MSNIIDDIIVGDIGMFGMYWPWDPKEKVQARVRKNTGAWELFAPRNVLLYGVILATYAYVVPALRNQKVMDKYASQAQTAVKAGAKKSGELAVKGAKAGAKAGKTAVMAGVI